MKSKNKRAPRPEPSFLGALKALWVGLAVFLCTSVLTSLVAAAVACTTPDPGSTVTALGLAVLYVASFFGGFATCRKNGGLALISGSLCGVALTVTTLLASLLIPDAFAFGGSPAAVLCTRLPTIALSVLGAYAATVRRAPKKRRRRK